jgi:hypothetical protein
VKDKTEIIPSELGKLLAIPQLGRPTIVTPKIIEEGKEIVRPDALQAVVQLAQLGQLTKIKKALEKTRESLEKEEFEGKQYSITLNASDRPKVYDLIRRPPHIAWATASFFNDGDPADPTAEISVYIAINDWIGALTLKKGETHTADFAKADRRIEEVYYWCNQGETASVRVVGKY